MRHVVLRTELLTQLRPSPRCPCRTGRDESSFAPPRILAGACRKARAVPPRPADHLGPTRCSQNGPRLLVEPQRGRRQHGCGAAVVRAPQEQRLAARLEVERAQPRGRGGRVQPRVRRNVAPQRGLRPGVAVHPCRNPSPPRCSVCSATRSARPADPPIGRTGAQSSSRQISLVRVPHRRPVSARRPNASARRAAKLRRRWQGGAMPA
jgi:hypothetical protein